MKRTIIAIATIACAVSLPVVKADARPAAANGEGRGHWYAVDGDTIDHDGHRIRLWGIDAPELHQECSGVKVGAMAKSRLQVLLDAGTVTCRSMGTDKYARTLGVCVANGVEVNRQMVRDGYAKPYLRYSHDYASDVTGKGPVWEWRCEDAETWRHRK